MATLAALGPLVRGVRPPDVRADAQLLADFFRHRDEAAFAELVRRHQRAVWATCCRVLGCRADAEDAFQATFLVLMKTGRLLADRGSVGGWLRRVAERVARKARAATAGRVRRERAAGRAEAVPSRLPADDLFALVATELDCLPENHRLAVVLCDLEGLTRADAAARLGWGEGTLSARLHRGRKALATRLRARGITLPLTLVGLLTAGVVPVRAAAVAALAGGLLDCSEVPPAVAALVSQTTTEMAMRMTVKAVAAGVLVAGLIGVGWLGVLGGGGPQATAAPVPEVKAEPGKPEVPAGAVPLLRNRKVLKALDCTPEQRVALEDLFDEIEDAGREARLLFDATIKALPVVDGIPDPVVAQRLVAQFKTKQAKQSAEDIDSLCLLTRKQFKPAQLRRLLEIDLQVRWAEAFTDPKLQEFLKLTAEQKKTVTDVVAGLKDSFVEKQTFIRGGAGPGVVFTPDSAVKGGSAGFDKVEALLTKEQKVGWAKLTGEAIDFEKLHESGSAAVYRVIQNKPMPVFLPGDVKAK